MALLFQGHAEEAVTTLRQEPFEGLRLVGLVMAYHALGEVSESDRVLAELIGKYERLAPYYIAYALAFRNEADQAFAWQDKTVEYADPSLSLIVIESELLQIRSDPRWIPFLESIARSPEQLAAIDFEVKLPKQPRWHTVLKCGGMCLAFFGRIAYSFSDYRLAQE